MTHNPDSGPTVGQAARLRRGRLGWTIEELAKRSGVSIPCVISYELGSRTTQAIKAAAIEKSLKDGEMAVDRQEGEAI